MRSDQIRQGRLSGERSANLEHFLASMDADRWIAEADLLVDMAHLLGLRRQGIIDEAPARALMAALLDLHDHGLPAEAFDERFEDIHAGKEACLIDRVGEDIGGRLHMGRSRNDEVATCIRIRLKQEIIALVRSLADLRATLLDVAAGHTETVMPGFTHLQHAQPTTLAHYLLAYEQAFSRDAARLREAYARVDVSPLGSAAFASTGFPLDRDYTARLLGFARPAANSMDAVAARDFALEVLSSIAICMTTTSRLCEELVLWSTSFFGFVQLDDAYCSSSSIMPQKKNPDVAEIMRAKAGTVAGALTAAITITKGLPMSYNRDLQELTPHLWRGVEAARESLPLLSGMIGTATFNTERMAAEAGRGFSTATELADVLVREYGLAFRTAHRIVGRAVRHGSLDLATLEGAAREAAGLSVVDLGVTQERIDAVLDPRHAVAVRTITGGPAPAAVAVQLAEQKELLARDVAWAKETETALSRAFEDLISESRRMIV
ncbi:MAG: argininosuccinate lyase [Methanoculleus bourgensis]|jgi:argininosuccinate lyase|uniref:Argininosuccinate lyase n=1 Tax=Methanoculleus bourgensis TaxID=83986 RepID=A0A8T7HA42_9EURY|nr:argininosuccinate lyase [Methanoculleus bourgensis]NQS77168.1 argininosuccinate lyase [Methanoculleus bourgensis]SAI88028.1 argininosuccinate lyase [Methanoculleus bourgensis]